MVFPVAFDFVLKVPDNIEVSSKFSSEIGSIVRVHAPVQHDGWKNVPLEDKRLLHEKLSVLFDVDLAHPKIDEYVDGKMSKAYTSLKWRLHQHYLAYKTPQEGRPNLPRADLWNEKPESHWHWLCDNVYTDSRWVEIARKNANNRNKQKYPHKGGSRPFIQHAKKAAKDGAQFSMIDNWETVHKDKNKQWVHDDAREKYDKMKRMRDEHKEKLITEAPEDTPLDSIQLPIEAELEIMSKTLGRKGRSIYGVGSFPRLETTKSFATSSMASKSELAEIQSQVKLLATSYKIMQEENEKLKAQVTALLTSQGKSSGHSNEPNNYQDDDDDDPYEDELADYA